MAQWLRALDIGCTSKGASSSHDSSKLSVTPALAIQCPHMVSEGTNHASHMQTNTQAKHLYTWNKKNKPSMNFCFLFSIH